MSDFSMELDIVHSVVSSFGELFKELECAADPTKKVTVTIQELQKTGVLPYQ